MSIQTPFNQKASQDASTASSPLKKWLLGSYALGLSVALSLTAITSPADAATLRFGDVDVQIDTTVSAGFSVLTETRETQFLPVANGGPAVNQVFFQPVMGAAPDFATCATEAGNAYGQFCQDVPHTDAGTRPNFDGSINTDDGRLNFDRGDVSSAPLKITSEFEARVGAFTGFARVNAFYDVRLMDEGSFRREGGGLDDDGQTNAGRNLTILDAYVDYDGEMANIPFTIRAGRQVINWGEATFIPGGNSAFSPIDVAAIRRPGAEIKEALLPVEALYGSFAITQDITVEGYVGGWEEFKLDSGGTLFGGSDAFTKGSTGGNPENVYYIGGGKRSGQQFACNLDTFGHVDTNDAAANAAANTAALTAAGLTNSAAIAAAVKASGAVDCDANPNIDVLRDWTVGQAEQERALAGDTNIIRGGNNDDGDESYGLAVRWYAENLNSTEFAAYYQKVDSRIPYISYRTGKAGITASSTGYHSSTVGRGAGLTGCFAQLNGSAAATTTAVVAPAIEAYFDSAANPTEAGLRAAIDTAFTGGGTAVVTANSAFFNTAYSAVTVDDEYGLLSNAAIQTVANGAVPLGTATALVTSAANTAASAAATAAIQEFDSTAPAIAITNLAVPYARAAGTGANVASLQETNCLTYFAQRDASRSFASPFDPLGQLPTGATNLQFDYDIGLFAEYPEVEIIGMSFNTTAFGWGVQGDFTFRPEMPLQLDTDPLTIAALFNNCAFATVAGLEAVYLSGTTYATETGEIGCTDQDRYLKGYTEDHDAYTWDIGTTATFTRSNPVVSFLRADLGILLTEFQGVIAEDIEELRGNTGGIGALGEAQGITPLNNVCQGGSDLPLNGILSIDDRNIDNAPGHCRPTDSSWGAVLFAQLQYNNVFGTPFSLTPTVVFNHGVEGFSPAPLGFWREDVGSSSFRMGSRYLDAWQLDLAYTTYHGHVSRTRNLDRDTVSFSASYAF